LQVYATEAAAEIGKLMMKELLCMHAEFVQSHGRPVAGHKPAWLNLTALPEKLRNSSSYRCLSSRGNWQPMYRFGPPVVPYMLFEISEF
jgi:integrator complex subunit 9